MFSYCCRLYLGCGNSNSFSRSNQLLTVALRIALELVVSMVISFGEENALVDISVVSSSDVGFSVVTSSVVTSSVTELGFSVVSKLN